MNQKRTRKTGRKKKIVSISSTACPGKFVYLYHPLFYTLFSIYACLCGLEAHTFLSCFLPLIVYVCVYVCLWWAGRKSTVKWSDSSNVGQDWDQRDWETDPSVLCKSVPQKTTGPFIKPPPAEQHARTHAHMHTHQCLNKYWHFWQTFHVKICNMAKLKTFLIFLKNLNRPAKQIYFILGGFISDFFVVVVFALKISFCHIHFATVPLSTGRIRLYHNHVCDSWISGYGAVAGEAQDWWWRHQWHLVPGLVKS